MVISLLLLARLSCAQEASVAISGGGEVDTNYVETFQGMVTGRLYISQKYTNTEIFDEELDLNLLYSPNTTLNLGVGATYKGFSLNLAYGFGFLNPDEGQGETTYLDLQSHVYKRKTVIDMYGQFYNGLYLENTPVALPGFEDPFYLRPDMRIRLFGFSYMHLFKGDRFSFSASFIQDEIQKKSAGSFLLGGEVALVYMDSDSTIIPNVENDTAFASVRGLNQVSFLDYGPKVGYTHTFVIFERFFITGALFLRLAIGPGRYRYDDGRLVEAWVVNPSASARFALGYNTEKFYLGISTVNSTFSNALDEGANTLQFGVGNVRINFAKRFSIDRKWQERIEKLPVIN